MSDLNEQEISNEDVKTAQSEQKEFSSITEIERLILEQKKDFRPYIFFGVLGVIAVFYAIALSVAVKFACMILRNKSLPHDANVYGELIFLSMMCVLPTVLTIIVVKALFATESKEKKEPDLTGDIPSLTVKVVSAVTKNLN